jgi:hypothetical protein
MRKKILLLLPLALAALILLLGNTHRILPSSKDPCQQDMTHKGHLSELPMFHCIGHTEYVVDPDKKGLERVVEWDHLHPWMTLEWHLDQGFSREHALELINKSTSKSESRN